MSANLTNSPLDPSLTNANSDNLLQNSLDQLRQGCLDRLDQCEELLQALSQENYTTASRTTSSVGTHMRHIFDRFHSVFNGLTSHEINYDVRKRDKEVENNLQAAHFMLQSLQRRLESADFSAAPTVMVREAVCVDANPIPVASTPARELMGLVSHSTHHLAIIAMIMSRLGISIADDFGKAASTLRYEQQ